MNEDQFQKILDFAIANRTDDAPENAKEFDVYADMHYNLYMFINGEWANIGLNVTPSDKLI
jgi:hypothetical protein